MQHGKQHEYSLCAMTRVRCEFSLNAQGNNRKAQEEVVLLGLHFRRMPLPEKRALPSGKRLNLKSNLNRKLSESDRFILVVRFCWAAFYQFFERFWHPTCCHASCHAATATPKPMSRAILRHHTVCRPSVTTMLIAILRCRLLPGHPPPLLIII